MSKSDGLGPRAVRSMHGASTMSRLGWSAAAGVVAALIAGLIGSWDYAAAVGWDVAATVFCSWIWLITWPMDAAETASRARAKIRVASSATS